MKSTKRNVPTVIALTLVFAVTQVYFGLTFAASVDTNRRIAIPQQISGILTTQDNKPINVNGASAGTGATILNGALIETPAGVTATINIPGHGSITISESTRLTITLDDSGNIRIALAAGCAVLQTSRGTAGEIDNAQGVIGKTDTSQGGRIDACPTRTAAAAASGGGLSTGAKVAIAAAAVGGGAAALAFGLRGSNPSRSAP
jgi:hypothetical protein